MNKSIIINLIAGLMLAAGFQSRGQDASEPTAETFAEPAINLWPIFTRNHDGVNILGLGGGDVEGQAAGGGTEKNVAKAKSKEAEQLHFVGFFPLYMQAWDSKRNSIISFPLFWYTRTSSNLYFNLLGPVYHYHGDLKRNTAYNAVIWPVCEYRFDKHGALAGWHLWPVVSWNNRWLSVANFDPGSVSILGPLLFQYSRPSDRYRRLSLLLLYHQSRESVDAGHLPRADHRNPINLRQPMAYEPRESANVTFFPLWFDCDESWAVWRSGTDHKKLDRVVMLSDKLSPFCRTCGSELCSHRRHDFKFSPGPEQQDAREKLLKLLPELQIAVPQQKDGKINVGAVRRAIAEKYTTSLPYHRTVLPLLFDYQRLGRDYRWNVLMFIVGGKSVGRQYRFDIMEYLYRYEQDGDTSWRFVFPFILQKTAPNRSHFSFLWRVFEYSTDHGKSSGHVMFIPF